MRRQAENVGRVASLALALVLALLDATVLAAEFPCLIEPNEVVDASTAVEGVVARIGVEKGDVVDSGAVVAVLESDVEKALVELAKARVEMSSALRAREVSLRRSREKLDRAVKLSSSKFVSHEEIEELSSAVELAELELETERENRLLAEIELKRVTALYEQRFIHSPIRGVVVERFLSAGEFAQAQPIVRLAQLDPLNVEVVLPGTLYGKVREGMEGEVVLPPPIDATRQAKVTVMERVIDGASGTFGVRLELPNGDYAIPSGLECMVRFKDID